MSRNSDTATLRRPQNEDMSMDEILASIRRIISDEEANEEMFVAAPGKNNGAAALRAEEAAIARQKKLSASDQLRALSSALYADNEERHYYREESKKIKTPPFTGGEERSFAEIIKNSEHRTNGAAPRRATTTVFPESVTSPVRERSPDREMSVNAAMERIRSALSEETERKKYFDEHPASVIRERDTEEKADTDHAKLNFKSEEIGDIPGFLKKFSRTQKAEREREEEPIFPVADKKTGMLSDEDFEPFEARKKPKYDFRSAPGFDEDDAVLCLTESVTPEKANETPTENVRISDQSDNQEKNKSASGALALAFQGEENADALELLMMRCLRPMLSEWIEENLQATVEKIVREELYKRAVK